MTTSPVLPILAFLTSPCLLSGWVQCFFCFVFVSLDMFGLRFLGGCVETKVLVSTSWHLQRKSASSHLSR